MKKFDMLILIGVVTALLMVFSVNIGSSFASSVSALLFGSTEEKNHSLNLTKSVGNLSEEIEERIHIYPEEGLEKSVETFETKTGMELEIGKVYNPGDERNVTIEIEVNNKLVSFNVLLHKNDTWSYGLINGILIFSPESGLIIDADNTNYYKFNNQLKASLLGKGRFVYIYSQKQPSRVVADVSTKWKYENNFVIIELASWSKHSVIVDWTRYPLYSGILYVEDKTKLEELQYQEKILNKKLSRYETLISSLESRLSELNNITASLKNLFSNLLSEKENLEKEKQEIDERINEVNATKIKLEEKLSGKTVISPLKAILLGLALLIIISYIVLFQLQRIALPKEPRKKEVTEIEKNEVNQIGGGNEV